MNWLTVILLVLIIAALTGGFGGYWPHPYGIGGATLLLIILLVLVLAGH